MEIKCIFNIGKNISIRTNITQVSDVAHGPLVFIAIHNEGPDYINEVISHIINLILCWNSSYLPLIYAHVLAWRLHIAQEKSLIKCQN
jgi:hypothetical protein